MKKRNKKPERICESSLILLECTTSTLQIKVYENITIGTVIVFDIRKLIGISKSTYIKLSPSSLTQFFRLDNITGNLYSISSIDLETSNLCNTERSCCPNHQYEQVTNQLDTTTNDNNNNQYSINQLNYHSEDLSNNLNQCRLTTFILASADNEIQISPIAKLHVHIIDLNDNPPQFNVFSDYQTNYRSKSIHLSFLEGSLGVNTKHDLPRAFDADFSIINRVKNYWIEWDDMNHGVSNNLHQSSMNTLSKSSSISTITHTNGQIWSKLGPFRLIYTKSIENLIIQLDQGLDREEQFIYKLRLIAQDGGDLRGSIQLIIEVDDVNEFPPIFIDSDYDDNQMKDSHIGSRIGQLKAIDYDLSMSNETTDQITYHFSSNQMNWDVTHIFHLDSQTGILTLKHSLDYESVKNYRLTIIAQDGPIIYSSTALIDIIVLDVNDNLPMIYFDNDQIIENKQKIITGSSKALVTPSQSYEIWIKENIPKHTPIIFFNVIDRDTGQNSRISCQLLNSTDIFSIHELSDLYRIETQSLLDREYIDQYTIIIQCNDMGEPMLYNTKSLIIHLIDVNDSPPSFPLNMYHYHVLENSSPGTPVQPISTTYPTTIIATDSDLNNTLIYRLEPIEMIMLKNQSNYKENYVIQSLDYQLFSIDPNNGQIFTQGDLDREKKSTLEFCVCVDDSLHLTCIKVLIDLDDINDNPPQFQHDTYIIHLDENKQYYKPIIIFIVTDLDSNNKGFKFNILLDSNKPPEISTQQNDSLKQFNHSKFQKSIELNEHSNQNLITKYFTLRDNGLYLQNVLDREERANYHFYIQVQDVHNELSNQLQYNLTSQTEVFIHVNDINDNIPTFIFPNGSTSAGNRLITSCHEMIGSSIGQIQGYDPDLGINGTIIYHLMMTTSYLKQSLFHLDNNTGELFINSNQLNQFCGQSITLLISIDDQGPQLSKIGKHSTMEHLIIQLDDMPIKNQQLSQKWRINHNSLLESNVFTSTNMNSNTSQSSSLLSTPSLSPLQQKKRQLHTSPSSSSPPNGIECRQSCIGDQSKYISNVIVDHRNNCMITPGCFISNGAETELPTLKTLTQQQQQQHNDRIQPIPVKLNIQSHCDNLQNQLDNDQGRLNGSQQIFENNDKYNITQDYQRIFKMYDCDSLFLYA
ncbi:putative cadherin [Schistosoma mansoni]|uniref:putative cadherin n=1 Tax=Schistosoma mansoni TaxID=6183 RepID=UPI00022DC03B|nr:putative cadherin [Schistosoma mansoni]|eukprot:XP_018651629.1 putative cadherin [Schistosoma mansoni]